MGVAEDLEVQKIAGCYWRKMRAIRYEHGAIGSGPGTCGETLEWLVKHSPDEFVLPDGTEAGDLSADEHVAPPPDYMHELLDGIDAQLRRLARLRPKVVRTERLDLESKIKDRRTALPHDKWATRV